MTPAQLFSEIGQKLYGEHFRAPLAATLEVNIATVAGWSKGRRPAPQEVWLKLVGLLQDREQGLPQLKLAARRVADLARLRGILINVDGTHLVRDDHEHLFRGTLDACDEFLRD